MLDSRDELQALDAADELRAFRAEFELPEAIVYLDGNSLGALPRRTRARIARTVEHEWGRGLIGSWDAAGWIAQPRRIGDQVARLIGAGPGQVVVADSTSVNLFKVLSVALAASPSRRVVLSERDTFPTDLYMVQGLLAQLGGRHELVLVEEGGVQDALARHGAEAAVVMLTHVDYRSGRMHDMAGITAAAQAAGAIAVWDLAHSAGAVPLEVDACNVDFAVGCGYKYLNGGPGAPAFVYAARRWHDRCMQPLSGWMGHADPFAFRADYAPAPGIARFLCGTPSVIAMAALECGVELLLEASMDAIRRKSLALADTFDALVERRCAGLGLRRLTPREPALRGSQVSYSHPRARAAMQALVARGVVGDFREPDVLRFGFAPLYTRYVDVWDAVAALRDVLRD